ncbi:hypothetical protein ABZX65_27100 [Streptomyces sp. NPDC003300]|uniref:hypothetical protein n=1 Tax=unclassified Streptomyces TaxID=2593676 RepID=UPI0033BFAE54
MKTLTIRQPWADAIVHVDHPRWGRKRIENRTWAAPATAIGTRILIHAAKTGDRRALDAGVMPGPDVRGAIIGTALLAGCHLDSIACKLRGCGPWANPEVYHWALADVVALPAPAPAKGALGLWTPDATTLDAVMRQIEVTA